MNLFTVFAMVFQQFVVIFCPCRENKIPVTIFSIDLQEKIVEPKVGLSTYKYDKKNFQCRVFQDF